MWGRLAEAPWTCGPGDRAVAFSVQTLLRAVTEGTTVAADRAAGFLGERAEGFMAREFILERRRGERRASGGDRRIVSRRRAKASAGAPMVAEERRRVERRAQNRRGGTADRRRGRDRRRRRGSAADILAQSPGAVTERQAHAAPGANFPTSPAGFAWPVRVGPDYVRKEVDRLKVKLAAGLYDERSAHVAEDHLYRTVLEAISQGVCEEPRTCAALVLELRSINFVRYYGRAGGGGG